MCQRVSRFGPRRRSLLLGYAAFAPAQATAFARAVAALPVRAARTAMALTAPRTPPGVLELLPLDQIAFQEMLDTVRRTYERFGFLPVETPVMELSDVLLTKEGGETERQVYFVQSTGALEQGERPEMALRFDLTVPLARYVAQRVFVFADCHKTTRYKRRWFL